jgi:hypothetical protein
MKIPHASILATLSLALLASCGSREKPKEAVSADAPAVPDAGIPTTVTEVDPATLAEPLLELVNSAAAGMKIESVEKKERQGRTYLDIEGRRPDGEQIELDVLVIENGYQLVEVQRDVEWVDVPKVARDAASAAGIDFLPARVIESRQTDGSFIYELFEQGKPDKPAKEVRLNGGSAEVLKEEWQH